MAKQNEVITKILSLRLPPAQTDMLAYVVPLLALYLSVALLNNEKRRGTWSV
jgi:hypothetical protein